MDQIGKIKVNLSRRIKIVLPVAAWAYFTPKDKIHYFRMTIPKAASVELFVSGVCRAPGFQLDGLKYHPTGRKLKSQTPFFALPVWVSLADFLPILWAIAVLPEMRQFMENDVVDALAQRLSQVAGQIRVINRPVATLVTDNF